jgi:membrane glycosyltransferase
MKSNNLCHSFTAHQVCSLTDAVVAPVVRRAIFFGLVFFTAFVGISMMFDILRANGMTMIETAILLLFGVTFGWIVVSFWTAVIGFVLQVAKLDPISLHRSQQRNQTLPAPITARIAVVMPVYNEDPIAVLAGLEATFHSLMKTREGTNFDFFILSDTTDTQIAAAEERGWVALCRRLDAEGKIFYRRRERNISRKAGNIAEFCCRWGQRYDFVVVLDADSIMSGETILALARTMQTTPRAGIVQTVPIPVGQQTMFGRFVQFAARLYSPMLATGLSFWQLGEANYWGHNAIIRIAPFMRHCGLPVLPGKPPLGGEILSHDFVEAALMRRGGWYVYLLPDLEGSYEGVPPNMLDFVNRDRRWAQGNLQHLKLLAVRGLHPLNRLHFLLGALAYASSLIWFLLLALSTVDALARALRPYDFFSQGYQLFPDWPIVKSDEIVSLLVVTVVFLLLPKVFGVLLCLMSRERRTSFGGAGRLLASALIEVIFSTLIVPLMMLFHAYFVMMILGGQTVSWNPQTRGDRSIGVREAARYVFIPTLIGVGWGMGTFLFAPQFFWWLTPVLTGLGLALVLVTWSSRVSIGHLLRRFGLFLTPEELNPPAELQFTQGTLEDQVSAMSTLPSPLPVPTATPPETYGEMQPQWAELAPFWSRGKSWDTSRSAT